MKKGEESLGYSLLRYREMQMAVIALIEGESYLGKVGQFVIFLVGQNSTHIHLSAASRKHVQMKRK